MSLFQPKTESMLLTQCINFQALLSEQEILGDAHPLFQKQDFLGLLIKFGSLQDHQTHLVGLACNGSTEKDACKGLILVLKTEKTGEISWGCDTCTESGELLNWGGSPFDLSIRAEIATVLTQEDIYRIRLNLDEYQMLISPENLYFDIATERVLFRAKLSLGQIEVSATETEMENMFALIASSIKHEPSDFKREVLARVYRLIQVELDRDLAAVTLDS